MLEVDVFIVKSVSGFLHELEYCLDMGVDYLDESTGSVSVLSGGGEPQAAKGAKMVGDACRRPAAAPGGGMWPPAQRLCADAEGLISGGVGGLDSTGQQL